jgi:hypothetical protein
VLGSTVFGLLSAEGEDQPWAAGGRMAKTKRKQGGLQRTTKPKKT